MKGKGFDISEDSEMSFNNKIEKRVWIKAAAEVVFAALTNAKALGQWFCDHAECTPCKGGELIAFWKTGGDGQKGRAIFTSIVADCSMDLLWIEDGRDTIPDSPKHTLSYTIKSKSGMTEVVMVDNDEAELDEETYTFLDQGWNSVLLELKDYCERKDRSVKLRSESKSRAHNSSSAESE